VIRVYADFNDQTSDGGYWILQFDDVPINDKITEMGLSNGDRVLLYQDEDDFEVEATLHYKFVDAINREGWVAYPHWATLTRVPPGQIVPSPPANLHPRIREYAEKVRRINLRDSIVPVSVIRAIDPHNLSKGEKQLLVDEIVSWTGHPGAYRNFLNLPISEVRKGLTMLFDESLGMRSRLEQIFRNGYLSGLRMPSLSLLLYWRNPERYPPYNNRTKRFLIDFKLQQTGMSASSPRCYEMWLRFAARLSQKLHLPTVGHIDRIVELHYETTSA
jgi:hypothetical protein